MVLGDDRSLKNKKGKISNMKHSKEPTSLCSPGAVLIKPDFVQLKTQKNWMCQNMIFRKGCICYGGLVKTFIPGFIAYKSNANK